MSTSNKFTVPNFAKMILNSDSNSIQKSLHAVILDEIRIRWFRFPVNQNQTRLAQDLSISRGTARKYLKELGLIKGDL